VVVPYVLVVFGGGCEFCLVLSGGGGSMMVAVVVVVRVRFAWCACSPVQKKSSGTREVESYG
jgi:hypothetical protein